MDANTPTSSAQANEAGPSSPKPQSSTDRPRVFTTPPKTRKPIPFSSADRLMRKMRHENRLIGDLGKALRAEEFDIRSFGSSLAIVARYISGRELESPERSPLHYRISLVIDKFFSKHEALYERRVPSIFSAMHRAVASSSNKEHGEVLYALSATFILFGPLLFKRLKTLKLLDRIFNCVPKRRTIKLGKLHSLTERCLLWSFSRVIMWGVKEITAWWNALQIIEPHIRVCEVPELLSFIFNTECPPEESQGSEYLENKLGSMLVHALIERRRDAESREFALKFLLRLLGCGPNDWPAARCTLASDNFLKVEALIKNENYDSLCTPPITHYTLRPFTDDEVDAGWDFLASAWYVVIRSEVRNAPRGNMKLKRQTAEMWGVLLDTFSCAEDAIGVVCDAHVKLFFELKNKRKAGGMDIPLFHAMQAIRQLWLVTMDHLEFEARATVAEMILRRLLERRDIFSKFEEERKMRTAWFKLIEELVLCNPLRALSVIATLEAPKDERSWLQRQIWCDITHFVVLDDVRTAGVKSFFSVGEMVEFLRFPYKMEFDHMDEYAHLLWDTLLGRAFDIAQERRKTSLVVELMEEVAREYGVKIKEGVAEKIRDEEDVFRDADRSRRPRPKPILRGRLLGCGPGGSPRFGVRV